MKIEQLNNGAATPQYATEGSAGFDLIANANYDIRPLERQLVTTGLCVAIPQGYEMQIRPRSGLALKHGVTVLNAPATIDSDYRGEIGVILMNLGEKLFSVKKGDRIAQGVIAPVMQADFTLVDNLTETSRGNGGFGSTGG